MNFTNALALNFLSKKELLKVAKDNNITVNKNSTLKVILTTVSKAMFPEYN